ncbi:tRNA lysidine(34) synthetase [Desulfovibrio litoralis]|uniref:PP-loop family protein n=1 Tax=Desulfovibrio litoralis DSM 11393 TaxID=1121455 RepID=A0A1M7SS74_9BACT|nr:tRNA 2-thiocytidine biosynthesis TtcA family protein [Desulfovibrio litoralis]SHN61387.1 PP-loop family protein [Desulfovibrio litoralis DSM 11393]
MSRHQVNYVQAQCIKAAGKLMQEMQMVKSGSRIGVAVSGGADSYVLMKVLKIRQSILPFKFELFALHINPGFDPNDHLILQEWLLSEGIPYHMELTDHGPRAHSEENRTGSPCFLCAKLRRKRLFELCGKYNLSHLAFGHNADDLVSSFLMNLFQTGRVEGMSMAEPFFRNTLQIIRPLMLLEKKIIEKAAKAWKLPISKNSCPSSGTSNRAKIMQDLNIFCDGHKNRRKNISNGLVRWQLEKHMALLNNE